MKSRYFINLNEQFIFLQEQEKNEGKENLYKIQKDN